MLCRIARASSMHLTSSAVTGPSDRMGGGGGGGFTSGRRASMPTESRKMSAADAAACSAARLVLPSPVKTCSAGHGERPVGRANGASAKRASSEQSLRKHIC